MKLHAYPVHARPIVPDRRSPWLTLAELVVFVAVLALVVVAMSVGYKP